MSNNLPLRHILPALCVIVFFTACPGEPGNETDKTALTAAINEAKQVLTDASQADYPDAYAEFQAAIISAEAVRDNSAATQEEVDLAKATLITAQSAFEAAQSAFGAKTKLVKFNAPEAAYDGSGIVSGFNTSGEKYLLFPMKINIKTDDVTIEAKVKINSSSRPNGVGFISLNGTERKGYMIMSAGGTNHMGTSGSPSGGGQGYDTSLSSPEGQTYIFKASIEAGSSGKKIGYYVYKEDGITLITKKNTSTDFTDSYGHAENDIVYAAIGGTNVSTVEWSDIKVTFNETTYVIDGLEEQIFLPVLSVDKNTVRMNIGESAAVTYKATASGGAAAEITAAADKPEIVIIDSTSDGTIAFTGHSQGDAIITVTNNSDTSMTVKIAVTVTDFPANDTAYGSLSEKLYPSAGSTNAYTDGELMITFDSEPELSDSGSVSIFDKETGEAIDVILFSNEKQVTLNGSINVGSGLARVEGKSVYITPHLGKLVNGKTYYIAIPRGAITGTLNAADFNGLSADKEIASWSFTTRGADPALSNANAVTVDGSQTSTANYRTVYGAVSAIAAKDGDWTITVASGTYNELVHYKTNKAQTITINGNGSEKFGKDVVIQYANGNVLNGGTHTRASFYFSGVNLVLKNITLKNTSSRQGGDPGQTEAIYFANGTGKTLAAYNSSFISHQDTIQTTGKNWFYKCYIEGDTDYIWGTADACLLEECELVSVNDPYKTNSKEAILLVARTGSTSAASVPKGYVIFNSKITTQDGMTSYFARNPGAGAYYDQTAVINTTFINEGTGKLAPALWSGSAYTPIEGKEEHVGLKYYGNKMEGGSEIVTSQPKGKVIPDNVYNAEYNGRRAILNRVYQKTAGKYEAASSSWDLGALETAFKASEDAGSK